MVCENCNNEIKPTDTVCPRCGAEVSMNVEGFANTTEIKKALKSMMDQHGNDIVGDRNKFISLLNDFIPEYDKERRLLKNMLQSDILANMVKEPNQKIAIAKAKEYMLSEIFLSENAAEFVVVCFTYMLGWEYVSPLAEKRETPPPAPVKASEVGAKPAPIPEMMKVFKPSDAARFRLKGNVRVPDGYDKIESFCFDGFSFMKTIEIPDSVTMIGEYAFSECKRLKSVELPNTIKVIKQGAFSQCQKLTMLRIPEGVYDIEEATFSFCQSLKIVEIPQSVSSIGKGAFSGCESLDELFLSENIKFIEDDAFSYCPSLVIKCYENSYVHKYCLKSAVKFQTVAKGTPFGKR